jgi:hypothetical protein
MDQGIGGLACWLDGVMIVNFEARTLPLLFAAETDMRSYFATMKQRLPRKAAVLEAGLSLCLEARGMRQAGDPLGCCQRLHEAAMLRRDVFPAADYQRVAAFEHAVWACVHLAVVEQAQHRLGNANALFAEALKYIRSIKVENHANFASSVLLCMEVVLHHNWANYWVLREKWNAAQQHASVAAAKFEKICPNEGLAEAKTFLALRRAIAGERLGEKLPELRTQLAAMLCGEGSEDGPPTGAVNGLTLDLTAAGSPAPLHVTLCLHSADPAYSWDAALGSCNQFLKAFTTGLICVRERDYRAALASLASLTHPPANPLWCERLEMLSSICSHGIGSDRVVLQATPKSATRFTPGLATQHLVKNYLLGQEARRERLRLQQKKKKHLLEEDPDVQLEEVAEKWKIEPSEMERRGLMQDHPEVAQVLPLLDARRSALRAPAVDASMIAGPQAVAKQLGSLRKAPPAHQRFEQRSLVDSASEGAPAALLGIDAEGEVRRAETAPLPDTAGAARPSSSHGLTGRAQEHIRAASSLYDAPRSTGSKMQKIQPQRSAPKNTPKVTHESVEQILEESIAAMEDASFLLSVRKRALASQSKKAAQLKKAIASSKNDCVLLERLAEVARLKGSEYDAALASEHGDAKPQQVAPFHESAIAAVSPDKSLVGVSKKQGGDSSPPARQRAEASPTRSLHQRQDVLRALLPRIDFRSSAYRDVVRELNEIEKASFAEREDRRLAELGEHSRAATRQLLAKQRSVAHQGGEAPGRGDAGPSVAPRNIEALSASLLCGLGLLFSSAAPQPAAMQALQPLQ